MEKGRQVTKSNTALSKTSRKPLLEMKVPYSFNIIKTRTNIYTW